MVQQRVKVLYRHLPGVTEKKLQASVRTGGPCAGVKHVGPVLTYSVQDNMFIK